MNILLTGHTGFIGSFLQDYLENAKFKVTGISLRETKIDNIFNKKYDAVIHTSGLAHQTKSIPYSEYERVNCSQTVELAEAAKMNGVKNFVFFSSVKVYGNYFTTTEISENTEIKPDDSYGRSKAEAEKSLLNLQDKNFKVTILRIPLVYGPNPKGNIKLLLKLTDKINFIPLNGISNRRSIVSINNLSEIVKQIIEKKIYGIFIPSDLETVSTTEIMYHLIRARNRKTVLFKLPEFLIYAIKIFFNSIYIRLYGDLYFNNSKSMNKIDKSKIHTSEVDFMRYYGK